MKLHYKNGLLFASGILNHSGKALEFEQILVDTGSSGSVFSADKVESIGIVAEPSDPIQRVRGVGGVEFVFTRPIDRLTIGELEVENFKIEVGAMDYGFEIEGIVGLDFLMQTGAIVDLARLEIRKETHA
jgi:hypothetical protein